MLDRFGDRHLDRSGDAHDRSTNGDALAGPQRLDDGAIDVALTGERATARRAAAARVARDVGELEARENHLETTGLQLLRIERVADDVEREHAGGELGLGQRVGEQIPALTIDCGVGVADADARGAAERGDRQVVGCVGRGRLDAHGHTEVVRDDALVPVPAAVAEVVIHRLADAHAIARRGDHHLLGFEPFLVDATADQAREREHGRRDQRTADGNMTENTDRVEHTCTVQRR